jgi:TRAP-type C4-dicarboxylate transport system substrate-binding protein
MKKVMKVALAVMMIVSVLGLGITGCGGGGAAPSTPTAPTTPGAPAAGEVIEYKFATSTMQTAWAYEYEQNFVAALEEQSGGRIKIDYYPGKTLTEAKTVLDDTVMGKIDIGSWSRSHYTDTFPLHMLMVTGPFTSARQFAMGYEMVYDEYFKPRDEEVGIIAYPGVARSCNVYYPWTKDRAIAKVEDFKGLQMGVTSGAVAALYEAMGAIGVFCGGGEAYESLAKGVIDAQFQGPIVNAYTTKIYELGKPGYVIYMGKFSYMCHGGFFMNSDKYNQLPADLQQVVQDVGHEQAFSYATTSDGMLEDALIMLSEAGNEIIIWEPAEIDRAVKDVKIPVLQDTVNDLEAKGYPGQKLFDYLNSTVGPAVDAEYPAPDIKSIVAKAAK